MQCTFTPEVVYSVVWLSITNLCSLTSIALFTLMVEFVALRTIILSEMSFS